MTALSCSDEEDAATPGTSGTTTTAGKGSAGSAGKGGSGGTAAHTGGSSGSAGHGPISNGGVDDDGAPEAGAAGAGAGGRDDGGAPATGGAGADSGGAAGAAGAAGAGGEGSNVPAPLEIIGEWVDDYGYDQIIDADSWNSATIVAYDNATNTVYAQNPASDPYNPSKFTKTVYTDLVSDSFYFCLIVYDAATLADAQNSTKTADASDPEHGGCSTFPWSKASKP